MREIDTSTVGGRIKVARIKRGYSQEKLAELLHVTPVQISHYENNRNDIKVSVIKELAEKLEVSVSYLVDESGG
jgi:transcriptional regulator with XRE-family HTH domain